MAATQPIPVAGGGNGDLRRGVYLCHGQGLGHRAAPGGGNTADGQPTVPGIQLPLALHPVQADKGPVERAGVSYQ